MAKRIKVPVGVSDMEAKPKETLHMRLKKAKNNEAYWSMMVRLDTSSLNRTLARYAQVTEILAAIEAEIREAERIKHER